MDRCALFVDAGYLLADGAMAVHGTRHREAVSWDYPGLLQLLNSLSRERTGLPLLRCYWYEATVEGRRTPEHDTLADIPGLKLRLSRIRPGRREGVDAQVHRDLMTLARNSAICDAVVVSGDEDLAQVVCDAQDLGIRVTVVHITADGSWAVSRSLRQECDDLIELGGGHLRPHVSLNTGSTDTGSALANGHPGAGNGQPLGTVTSLDQARGPEGLPSPDDSRSLGGGHARSLDNSRSSDGGSHSRGKSPDTGGRQFDDSRALEGPRSRTGPSFDDSRALDAPRQPGGGPSPEGSRSFDDSRMLDGPREAGGGPSLDGSRSLGGAPSPDGSRSFDDARTVEGPRPMGGHGGGQALGGGLSFDEPRALDGPRALGGGPQADSSRSSESARPFDDSRALDTGHSLDGQRSSGSPHALPPGQSSSNGQSGSVGGHGGGSVPGSMDGHAGGYTSGSTGGHAGGSTGGHGGGSTGGHAGGSTGGPASGVSGGHGGYGTGGHGGGSQGGASPSQGGSRRAHSAHSAQPSYPGYPQEPQATPPNPASLPVPPPSSPQQNPTPSAKPPPPQYNGYSPTYQSPQLGPYTGPQAAPIPPQSMPGGTTTLADAVKAAHKEGHDFGESVARDAPALWLEAVLARKPRMPSDLEARLLQGSSLPIDFLLHDEVRHALRRGFWDALERARQ
ncbi:NYN domain-containing protein [Streptosporangium soli]|nr:NYN domain-containing protein [Streptosporangium sp. KLBMP 9127]